MNSELSDQNQREESGWTLDTIIQKIFPILGIVMIAGGLGYFLYTGFWDQVGKTGRLAAGFLAGLITILAGYNFQDRLKSFADTVIGGGILMLYVTLIYGGRFETAAEINQIIPEGFALFVSTLFSGGVAYYAVQRNSSQILTVGMVGAYLSPFWIGEVGGFDHYSVSYLGFLLYFLAINFALAVASFRMKAFGLMNVNSLGLFIGTLSLSGLVGDGMVAHPFLIPVIAFLITAAQILFAVQTVDQFQKEHKTLTVSSFYFVVPFVWIVTVLFGAFNSDEIFPIWGDAISISSLLMVGVAVLYFGAWKKLEDNDALPQLFNTALYGLGFMALALAFVDIGDIFGGYLGLSVSCIAAIFGVIHIFSPRKTREIAFFTTACIGVFLTMSDLWEYSAEFSGDFLIFSLENIIVSLSLAPFLLHFGMQKEIGSESSDFFHVRKGFAYFAGILVALLLGVDLFEHLDMRKDLLFFTLPAFVLAGIAWKKQSQEKVFYQYLSGSLTLLVLGYFATFFSLWDKLFPAHIDLPFSSFEAGIGFLSLLLSGGIYTMLQKRTSDEKEHSDIRFSALVIAVVIAFQFISYELVALYNVVIPPVLESSLYVDNAPVKGLRALLVSLWWVILASGLIYAGIHDGKKYIHEKRIGMLLLTFVLGKILLYDIAHLNTNLKVLLFIGTGSLILGLSYFRSKKKD